MTIWLALFIVATILNAGGLLLDLLLYLMEWKTISEIVWDHPLWGIPIILIQVVGLVGITFHFYRE